LQSAAAITKSVVEVSSTLYEASALGSQEEKMGRDEINVMMLPPPQQI